MGEQRAALGERLMPELVTPEIRNRAKDGSIVEVFEWKSARAIEGAHTNPAVVEMWNRFGDVCTYQKLVDLEESRRIISLRRANRREVKHYVENI